MNYLKNNKLLAVSFSVLMIAAIWVRTYQHNDWLYFKMDQARDTFMVGNAVKNGPEHLPLLGPRAGATDVSAGFLRLGPIFYYFQYAAGAIFNSTEPEVFAYPDLFFSILTIPLLYLFLRLYFEKRNSFLVTSMYAFSFLVIQYSRFAWNPNSLLFFTLLSFYGLLKMLKADSFKQQAAWAVVWALGTAIGSQLHFLGLFCLLIISGLVLFTHFQLWHPKGIRRAMETFSFKKTLWLSGAFLAVFLLIYSPVIISDVMRKGENTKNFIQAFSTKPNKKSLSTKISRSFDKQIKHYCLITTAECYKGKTKDNAEFGLLTALIMLSGLLLTARQLKNEKDGARKDFLRLLAAWFGIFFLLAIPLYSSLRPRFFISVFPIPFIFLGLVFQFLDEKFSSKGKYAALIITAAIIGLNIKGTAAWFKEQADSQNKNISIDRTLILKNQDGVTLGQLEKAADFIYEKKITGANIHFYVKPEHVQPIRYLLFQKNDPDLKYFPLKDQNDPNGQYFAVFPAEKNLKFLEDKFKGKLKVIDSKELGQIKVQEVEFLESSKKEDFRFNEDKGATDRVFWKDVFNTKNDSGAIEIDAAE
ncbi:MAG: hypothetical protein QG620_410 [Patescibacteria group bacterium]|nr:hypothetical protein [Patescibacteria group bacterium]